ncbi:MAG: hypothetical protein HN893_08510 [Rhodospirillales bacterium]|nr:hypothetical protein [Rhodospirillales bacterium]MBT7146935.1 hypothetical protein [Rhodospirillales bacterium]
MIQSALLIDIPQDIRLWLLAANPDTAELERGVPLPVAHDAVKRGLVRNIDGGWVLTTSGRDVLSEILDD